MKNKINSKLGTFSNDGLGSVFSGFDEDSIIEMRKILKEAESKLRTVYKSKIEKFGKFIEKKFTIIPDEDDFIEWYDKNKMYKNWQDLPKISNEDIFKLADEYLKECEREIKLIKQEKPKELPVSIVLEQAIYNIENLVFYFSSEVFKPNTKKDDIEKVFNDPTKRPNTYLNLKINNKKFAYLLDKMQVENILIQSRLFDIIEDLKCFKSSGGTVLKREHLDQAKHQVKIKPLSIETEQFLDELIKKIKKQ